MNLSKSLPFSGIGALLMLSLCLVAASCGKKSGDSGNFPENFNGLSDAEKVAYVMRHATPDSVARFICDASLGRVEGISIASLAAASNHAYENYTGDDLATFYAEYDRYESDMPLPEKMKLYVLAGKEDPQKLGYELGLSYVGNIRDNHLTADQVEKELKEFKKACGDDSDTYRRFIIGFHTALELERNNGFPQEIYSRFIKFE